MAATNEGIEESRVMVIMNAERVPAHVVRKAFKETDIFGKVVVTYSGRKPIATFRSAALAQAAATEYYPVSWVQGVQKYEKRLWLRRKGEAKHGPSDPQSQTATVPCSVNLTPGSSTSTSSSHGAVDIIPDALCILPNGLISAGAYGAVYKGMLGGSEVAVKIPHTGAIGALTSTLATEIGSFKAEAALLKQIHHPNIVTFLGTCVKNNTVNLVFERLSCNLHTLIHAPASLPSELAHLHQGLNMNLKFRIARDIIIGIEFLHNTKKIIHRDLKPGNILIDRHMIAKVADFGFGKWFQPGTTVSLHEPYCGTRKCPPLEQSSSEPTWQALYSAPELVLKTQPASTGSDIYALALLLWELFTEEVLFEGQYTDEADLKAKIGKQPHLHPEVPPNIPRPRHRTGSDEPVPPSLKELLERSLQFDPNQRPSISEVLSLLDRAWGEYTISSTPATQLWAQLSSGPGLVDEVAWGDFARLISTAAQVPLDSFAAVRDCVGFTISLDKFLLLYQCFGNFFTPNSGLLEELNVLCSQEWFVPFATLEDIYSQRTPHKQVVCSVCNIRGY
ncbi:serine/threonine kinase [Pelomyxa schiedti]|nr:serine/threonine kinase [Pelomyxa schiedti]